MPFMSISMIFLFKRIPILLYISHLLIYSPWALSPNDKLVVSCHCEEDASPTRQSIVSRGTRTTCLFGYWLTVDRHGLFTLHPSNYTLPSLAFLETYTEADMAVAVTRGVGATLCRPQVRSVVVEGTTP